MTGATCIGPALVIATPTGSTRFPPLITFKKDLINRRRWPVKNEACSAIFEWIEVFYNPVRRHSTVGMLSPADHDRAAPRTSAA